MQVREPCRIQAEISLSSIMISESARLLEGVKLKSASMYSRLGHSTDAGCMYATGNGLSWSCSGRNSGVRLHKGLSLLCTVRICVET